MDLTTISTNLEARCRWLARQSTCQSVPGDPPDPGEAPDLAHLRSASATSNTGSGRRQGAHGLGTGLPELSTLTSGDELPGDEPRGRQAEQAILDSDASFRTARGDSISLGGAPSSLLSEGDAAEAAKAALPGHDAKFNAQQPMAASEPDAQLQHVPPMHPQTAGAARATLPAGHPAHGHPLTSLSSYHASDNPFE